MKVEHESERERKKDEKSEECRRWREKKKLFSSKSNIAVSGKTPPLNINKIYVYAFQQIFCCNKCWSMMFRKLIRGNFTECFNFFLSSRNKIFFFVFVLFYLVCVWVSVAFTLCLFFVFFLFWCKWYRFWLSMSVLHCAIIRLRGFSSETEVSVSIFDLVFPPKHEHSFWR